MRMLNILLASLFLIGCSGSSDTPATSPRASTIQNTKPGIGPIAVFGDSLAAGYRGTDPTAMPAGCLSQLPRKDAVYMYAVPGYTSEQILTVAPTIEAIRPKLIFLSSGGNDTLREHNVPGSYPETKTLAEMSALFDRTLATGAVVVYLGLDLGIPGAERLPKISQLAQAKGVIVVDGMNGLWNDPDKMADTFHPNDKGYRIMCDRILQSITGFYP